MTFSLSCPNKLDVGIMNSLGFSGLADLYREAQCPAKAFQDLPFLLQTEVARRIYEGEGGSKGALRWEKIQEGRQIGLRDPDKIRRAIHSLATDFFNSLSNEHQKGIVDQCIDEIIQEPACRHVRDYDAGAKRGIALDSPHLPKILAKWEVVEAEKRIDALKVAQPIQTKEDFGRFYWQRSDHFEPHALSLAHLPDVFDLPSFQRLQKLNISQNRMVSLPLSLAHLPHLREVIASDNCFETLPEALTRMPDLTSLDLSLNRIREVPESLGKMSSLRTLDLSGNQIKTLPDACDQLIELQYIDLRGNHLRSLPPSCQYDPVFQKSRFEENSIPKKSLEEIPHHPLFLRNCPRWSQIVQAFNPYSNFRGKCIAYSYQIRKAMARAYQGRLVDQKLFLSIEGQAFQLSVVRSEPKNVKKRIEYHYYLLLSKDQEEWIIDPSWKQFLTLTKKEDPWIREIASKYPHILVLKKEDWVTLMQNIGLRIGEPSLAHSSYVWNNPDRKILDATVTQEQSEEGECTIM